nr:MAG TPA: hypothetical protein [Caudoviricetes sp.]
MPCKIRHFRADGYRFFRGLYFGTGRKAARIMQNVTFVQFGR